MGSVDRVSGWQFRRLILWSLPHSGRPTGARTWSQRNQWTGEMVCLSTAPHLPHCTGPRPGRGCGVWCGYPLVAHFSLKVKEDVIDSGSAGWQLSSYLGESLTWACPWRRCWWALPSMAAPECRTHSSQKRQQRCTRGERGDYFLHDSD